MRHTPLVALCVLLVCSALLAQTSQTATTQPITTSGTKTGQLLKQWWKEGTAAGNVGDWYDNRDRQHSGLGVKAFPQLSVHQYTPEELARRADWALRSNVLPKVVFGNSSTSSPAESGGSNPRHAYRFSRGLMMLRDQYRGNNLYIYPEHRDHDPAPDGYGDLYPTNTPYLLISQGSSGSDQPFMVAVPFTLAAFRPEVKKKLIDNGLLMPTVQMILRSSNNHLANADEYLTGKAHPTVFEGKWVDQVKMITLAHDIHPDSIPPMAQIKVVDEDRFTPGKDHIEKVGENLSDTPEVIARVWRAYAGRRRMVVSAEASFDLNKRPLKYRWVVLRGDAAQITITPKKTDGSVAELSIPYPTRRPIADDPKMQSSRIDIGLFVHNGSYWSAPAFVTFFGFGDESREYVDGRLTEIGYGMGETIVGVDWSKLMDLLRDPDLPRPLGWDLFRGQVNDERLKALAAVAKDYQPLAARLAEANAKLNQLTAASKEADDELKKLAKGSPEFAAAETGSKEAATALQAFRKEVDAAKRTADELLDRRVDALGATPRETILKTMTALRDDRSLLERTRPLIGNAKPAPGARTLDALTQSLGQWGVPPGSPASAARDSAYQTMLRHRINGEVLTGYLFPSRLVTAGFRRNLVDHSLSDAKKSWRDVFHHQGDKLTGWTRYDGQKVVEFGPDGAEKQSEKQHQK